MSREEIVSVEVPAKRFPRRLITVWTWGKSEFDIRKDIIKDVVPFYPEILEVLIPVKVVERLVYRKGFQKVQVPATPGYIYLKVVSPSFEMFDALRRIKWIGGIVPHSYEEALNGMTSSDVKRVKKLLEKPVEEKRQLSVGDLVSISSGPLMGSPGVVEESREDGVTVRFSFLGRMTTANFTVNELMVGDS